MRCVAATAVVLVFAAAGCGGDDDGGGEGPPIATSDPATTFAPLVNLHEKERWFPLSADDFIDYATVSWAIRGCTDDTIAIGAPRRRLGLDGNPPTVDPRRLGGGPNVYRNRTLVQPLCKKRRGAAYKANQLTRPYDETPSSRPAGLPVGDGFYLDLMSRRLKGKRDARRDGGKLVLRDVPVYLERDPAKVDGDPGVRLTYWLLYGVNETPGKGAGIPLGHEGDWERVSVLLRRDGAKRYVPVSVTYHADGAKEAVPWSDVERAGPGGALGDGTGDTHPVVYAARGNHSPYPSAGSRGVTIRQAGRSYNIKDDASPICARCPQWRTWDDVIDVRTQPWYGFGGAWGYVDYASHVPGARGPSPHPR